ncbi:MAG: ADP-ribosylglycohydrolase family protein [Actinobacteria bacterium]|nr:ADP-ribosylglycohydrolase family protein [Actinomycetota bacterium]
MLGAIVGDIIGSVYEFNNIKTVDFPLLTEESCFTDDTVLTVATADCILNGGNYADYYRKYYRMYPQRGYGGNFHIWGSSDSMGPYNSYGNGSAMRVSPVGFAYKTIEEVLAEAKRSAEVTHNHPEGIKGAQATAAAVYLARTGAGKEKIKEYIAGNFGYDLDDTIERIREVYGFNETCQGSVPQAIMVFLESCSYEDAVRKAVSIGGDSDTIACIAGGIAEAYYGGVPEDIKSKVLLKLDRNMIKIINKFYEIFIYKIL